MNLTKLEAWSRKNCSCDCKPYSYRQIDGSVAYMQADGTVQAPVMVERFGVKDDRGNCPHYVPWRSFLYKCVRFLTDWVDKNYERFT